MLGTHVKTTQTFDGVTIYLHADGSVSDRLRLVTKVKLPQSVMFRAFEDMCLYTYDELTQYVKSVSGGKLSWQRRKGTGVMDSSIKRSQLIEIVHNRKVF